MERSSLLGLINKALRANFDAVVRERLPRRWVDLIHHLNDLERAKREGNHRVKRRSDALQARRQSR
jgi:hypothetical protein